MNERTRLEQAAIAAHEAGMTWPEFWEVHRHTVGKIEPHDRQRFHRLVARLTALVAAGDLDGQPIDGGYSGPCACELDGQAASNPAAAEK